MNKAEFRNLLLFTLALIGSRIPFVFNGYGSEEDAWALPLVAERIGTTGIYEVSRLPGHPFQELIYSTCWHYGALFYNLLTVVISTTGILFFIAMLKRLHIAHAYLCGTALAFTPIVYINSCNAMDYTWAMAFQLISAYFIIRRNPVPAGAFLALAVGCRITSGALYLPYLILLLHLYEKENRFNAVFYFTGIFLGFSMLLFLPVYLQYGLGFFTYYEHFPLPGALKNIYKGTLAVWGLPALLTFLVLGLQLYKKKSGLPPIHYGGKNISTVLLLISALSVLLYTIAFILVPLKSAFMIPAVPFILLIFAVLLNKKQLKLLVISLVLSCFFFGINLADAYRGSRQSKLALHFRLNGQLISFDPLYGLVPADHSKKLQRSSYVMQVIRLTEAIPDKAVIISGWWISEILVRERGHENKNKLFRYYLDEAELNWYKENGYQIYYLEEQAAYNDLRYRKVFTKNYAIALPG